MPTTSATRHPSGVTLTPAYWDVDIDGRRIGAIQKLATAHIAHHHSVHGQHIANHSTWNEHHDLDAALGALIACERDTDRCAQAQDAQDQADEDARERAATCDPRMTGVGAEAVF